MRELQIGDRFASRGGYSVECRLTCITDKYYQFDDYWWILKEHLSVYFNTEHLESVNGRYYWSSNSWDT